MSTESEKCPVRMLRICLLTGLWGVCLLVLAPASWSQETAEWKLRVSAESASVRLRPSLESPVIGTLPKGTVLSSYEAEGEWFRVVLPPGKDGTVLIGYVAKSDVEILEEKIKKPADFWQAEEGEFEGLGIHVMLCGGLAMFSSGDIDKGAKGLFNSGADAIAARGVNILARSVKPLNSAVNMGGDVIYDLSPRIGIGLGFGYIHTLHVDAFRYSELKVYENTMNSVTDLTVTTFRIGAFYTQPLGRLFKLRINAGPAIFRASLEYNRNAQGRAFVESYGLVGKATKVGLQGGAMLDLRLLERASLFFGVQGRSAKISNFKGSDKLKRQEGDLLLPNIENSGVIYLVSANPYSLLAVYPEGSSDALGARKAVFDFSGVDLLAGLHIRF